MFSPRHLLSLILPVAMAFGSLSPANNLFAATFTVAPDGQDSNPGTPEKPLATLQAARDAARKAEAGPHRIVVMPGEYFLAAPLTLEPQDNGLVIEAGTGGSATLYGGSLVTGWQPDGDKFWAADLPEVRAGTWDFRALVVNGRMPERARLPESGTFLHNSVFDVRWLSTVGGGWDRRPTDEELTTMLYDPNDIPGTLDRSAALQQEKLGLPIVLLVPGAIRFLLARFLRRALPQLRVLSHTEIPDSRKIKITSIVGGNK